MQTDDLRPRIIHARDFAGESADLILEHAHAALAARGTFRLGLAGGNTPRKIHQELVQRAGSDFPWEKVVITFGDERCVPPDHADSNYLMAKESLLDHVPIPAENVLRMRGEADPEQGATEYEAALKEAATKAGEPVFVHDLLLLGMGGDGHTASLFPGSSALEEQSRWVLPVIGPKPPPQRLTMTFPLINASRAICFMVAEEAKQQVVDEVLAGDPRHPAAKVRTTIWVLGY
jgi:6-phosphogluconolactonase